MQPVADSSPPPVDQSDGFVDVFALPADARDALIAESAEQMRELTEACAAWAPEGGADVLALVTVDADGLLEMELSSYQVHTEGAEALAITDATLPTELVRCLDDKIWDLSWPAREETVRFGLALVI